MKDCKNEICTNLEMQLFFDEMDRKQKVQAGDVKALKRLLGKV